MIDRTGQVWMTTWEDFQHVFLIIHTDLNTSTELDKQRNYVKSLFSSNASGISLETKYIFEDTGIRSMEAWIAFKRIL